MCRKHLLVIGGGSIGERHIRCFLKTDRVVVSACDAQPRVLSHLTANYPLKNSVASLDEAMHLPFDAAVVCTPAHLHIPMALQLVRRRKGVLIEKPLSTSLDQIAELTDCVAASGVACSVAYVLRHHPALRATKSAIESGRFGKPVQVVVNSGQHFPFYRPAYREIYYARRETGGGAIQDALTHLMNAAQWLVGPVTRLAADADSCVLEGVDVEDTTHVLARHGSVLAAYTLNQHQFANESTLTVHCERGSARFEGHGSSWSSCFQADAPWTVEEKFDLQRDDLFQQQANAFLDQLEGKQTAACSLAEGLQTLRASLAALRAWEAGRWINV